MGWGGASTRRYPVGRGWGDESPPETRWGGYGGWGRDNGVGAGDGIPAPLLSLFGWKHDPYGKYKHESCFIKIELYLTYAKRKITLY